LLNLVTQGIKVATTVGDQLPAARRAEARPGDTTSR